MDSKLDNLLRECRAGDARFGRAGGGPGGRSEKMKQSADRRRARQQQENDEAPTVFRTPLRWQSGCVQLMKHLHQVRTFTCGWF